MYAKTYNITCYYNIKSEINVYIFLVCILFVDLCVVKNFILDSSGW